MNLFHAVILGIIQGITEFLPISSSAHLFLIPWILKWDYQGLAYDVALHWGSMVAIAACFWKDWLRLARAGLSRQPSPDQRLFWSLVLATIPAGVAGLLLENKAEEAFRNPALMASALIAFGLLLGAADRWGKKNLGMDAFNLRSCLLVGAAQALAIIPGVSRSGVTITVALCLGYRRDAAARFSFLLSAPIITAAGILKLRHIEGIIASGPFWVGIAASTIAGFLTIRFLLNYLKTKDVGVFVFYRVLFGILILLLWGSSGTHYATVLARLKPPQIAASHWAKGSVEERLRAHVGMLAGTIGERNPYNRKALDRARDYIARQFREMGLDHKIWEFRSQGLELIDDGTPFENIEVRIPAAPGALSGRSLILGAHYDSAPGTPGADDNASGVAVLLELARLLKDKSLSREIRLVAYANEEPPAFYTKNMGSYHHALSLKKNGEPIFGMVSLEMLGYYNAATGSQFYPPFLSWFFPNTGDFIGLVGTLSSRRFLKSCRQSWVAASNYHLETAALPSFISAAILSDHLNYIKAGYPGLMLTDTGYFRNPHYHELSDTPEKLDYGRMARVTRALAGMVERL